MAVAIRQDHLKCLIRRLKARERNKYSERERKTIMKLWLILPTKPGMKSDTSYPEPLMRLTTIPQNKPTRNVKLKTSIKY